MFKQHQEDHDKRIQEKAMEIEQREQAIKKLNGTIEEKDKEKADLEAQMLKMKDAQLDLEGKFEEDHAATKAYKEEAETLRDQLQGKDEAITHLSNNFLLKSQEQARLLEMHVSFKQRVMQENCFHQQYAAKMVLKSAKAVNLGIAGLVIGNDTLADVTLGFIRERNSLEEYFLVIETKDVVQ